MILVDSNIVIAGLDPRDPSYATCRRALDQPPDVLALPAPTIVEIAYLVHQRRGTRSEAMFARQVASGRFNVQDALSADYARAADLVEQYADFPLGTVDALIVAIAERLDVTRLLTLDRRHFGAIRPLHCEAFEILP